MLEDRLSARQQEIIVAAASRYAQDIEEIQELGATASLAFGPNLTTPIALPRTLRPTTGLLRAKGSERNSPSRLRAKRRPENSNSSI